MTRFWQTWYDTLAAHASTLCESFSYLSIKLIVLTLACHFAALFLRNSTKGWLEQSDACLKNMVPLRPYFLAPKEAIRWTNFCWKLRLVGCTSPSPRPMMQKSGDGIKILSKVMTPGPTTSRTTVTLYWSALHGELLLCSAAFAFIEAFPSIISRWNHLSLWKLWHRKALSFTLIPRDLVQIISLC